MSEVPCQVLCCSAGKGGRAVSRDGAQLGKPEGTLMASKDPGSGATQLPLLPWPLLVGGAERGGQEDDLRMRSTI